MASLMLARNRRLRRALGLLALFYLLGATLEPGAHAFIQAQEAPASTNASVEVLLADSSSEQPERGQLHHEFECVLCHAAGSPPLVTSPGVAVPPADPHGLPLGSRAPPLLQHQATEGQPRAPPLKHFLL